jgi:hypothetical protein
MPAALSYVTARAGEATPNNVVAYTLAELYWLPIPPANNNVKAWPSALATQGGVLPIIGDVRLGIDYGPTGMEFEGTYAPGGGSNTYSRGRVVNA